MLEQFDFEILRMRHLRAIMELQESFRPDNRSPDDLGDIIDAAEPLRGTYLTAKTARDLGRGTLDQAKVTLHDANVAVAAIAKSRYRADKRSLRALLKVPTQDQTDEQIEKRGKALERCWAALPLPPRPSAAETAAAKFIAYPGMTLANFTALLTALRDAQTAQPMWDEAMEAQEGDVNGKIAELGEINTAILVQGRAQFPTGTIAEMIDAVPAEPSTQPPEKPVISSATATGPGAVQLSYDAEGGSLFDVLDDPPGPVEEVLLLDDTPLKTVDLTGLAPGVHSFTVIAINSRGESEPSDPVQVTVS